MIGQLGGLVMPVAASSVSDSLAVLDPARKELAGLCAAAINGELGAAWSKVVATLPPAHFLRGTKPVQDVQELDPDAAAFTQRKPGFPILCCYRQGRANYTWKYNRQQTRIQRWNLDYILGPLAVDDVRRVGDVLTAASSVVAETLIHGFYPGHPSASPPVPAYGTGQPFAVSVAYVHMVEHTGPGWGKAENSEKPYYGLTMSIETWELTEFITDPATDEVLALQTGDVGNVDIDMGLAVASGEGVTIPHFIEVGPPVP